MMPHKLEGGRYSPTWVEVASRGPADYRLAKQQAQNFLTDTLFPLAPLSDDTKERIIKLTATTLLMQRINCNLLGITPSTKMENQFMLVGAIIDPYDGAQDESDLERSLRFCSDLFQTFGSNGHITGSSHTTASDTEARFYSYLSQLETEIPKTEYPEFWKTLRAMHMIQTISLIQRKDVQNQLKFKITKSQLFEISSMKGGLNAILFATLIDPKFADTVAEIDLPSTISVQELEVLRKKHVESRGLYLWGHDGLADAIFTAGAFVQHIDDFEDVPEDEKAEIQTAFTENPWMTFPFLSDVPFNLREIYGQFTRAGTSRQEAEYVLYYLGLYLTRKIIRRASKLI